MSQAKIKVARKATSISPKVIAASAAPLVAAVLVAVLQEGWNSESSYIALVSLLNLLFGYIKKDDVVPLSNTVVNDELDPADVYVGE